MSLFLVHVRLSFRVIVSPCWGEAALGDYLLVRADRNWCA